MDRATLTDRLAEQESARIAKNTREMDAESAVNWEKLLALALDRPPALTAIAQAHAPEAAARTITKSESVRP
jgi:hypothetical protein